MHTISRRLILATTAAIILMLILFAVYVANNLYTARQESRVYVQSLQENLLTTLNDKGQAIRNSAATISHSSYVEALFGTTDVYDRRQISRFVSAYVQHIIETNPDIIGFTLFSDAGLPFSYGYNIDAVVLRTIVQAYPEVFSDDLSETFEPFFTPLIKTMRRDGDFYAYVMPVYAINNPVPLTRIATCITLCDARTMQDLIDQTAPTAISGMRLYSGDNLIASREGSAQDGSVESLTSYIPTLGWTLEIEAHWGSSHINQISISAILLLVLLCCLLLAITALLLHSHLVRPVQQLIWQLAGLRGGERMTLRFGSELDVIVSTINDMLVRLDESSLARLADETKMYELQLHAKETELSALQSQINPHFLYNTLECMRSIGLFYEAPEIVDISNAMAAIFRYSIKSAPYVRLCDELTIVKQYFTIIDVRFEDRFALLQDVEEAALNCVIPKMVLQPLVENAIYHGLEPRQGRGVVTLRGRVRRGTLYINVEDDGLGIGEEDLSLLRGQLNEPVNLVGKGSSRSIGLSNIMQRLRLMAPESGLSVNSRSNVGTTVSLWLPALRQLPEVSEQPRRAAANE